MGKLTVAESQDRFLLDGRPFFYLADTAWAAFANLSLDEWARYLKVRRLQGFNALQISILPVTHDQSMSETNTDPVSAPMKTATGISRPSTRPISTRPRRWSRWRSSRALCPCWACFGAATCPARAVLKAVLLPRPCLLRRSKPYARDAAARFKRFDPAFFISGDTRFESPEEAPYYMAALQIVEEVCPDALLTMHLHPQGDLPPRVH